MTSAAFEHRRDLYLSQFTDPDAGPQILLSMFKYDNVITSVALLYKHVMQAKHIEKEPKVKPDMLYHGYTFGLPQGHARSTLIDPHAIWSFEHMDGQWVVLNDKHHCSVADADQRLAADRRQEELRPVRL